MKKYTLRLAQKIFAQAAGDPVLLRIVDDGKHPDELYIDLANESIAAALIFEDAWLAEVARGNGGANRHGTKTRSDASGRSASLPTPPANPAHAITSALRSGRLACPDDAADR